MKDSETLRAGRIAAGLKQKDLAHIMGIYPPYMNDLEQGRKAIPERLLKKIPRPIREPIVRARIAELEKLL